LFVRAVALVAIVAGFAIGLAIGAIRSAVTTVATLATVTAGCADATDTVRVTAVTAVTAVAAVAAVRFARKATVAADPAFAGLITRADTRARIPIGTRILSHRRHGGPRQQHADSQGNGHRSLFEQGGIIHF
jgi:hypothetical protein